MFLSALILSAALLALHAIELLAQITDERRILLYVPLVGGLVAIGAAGLVSGTKGQLRIASWEIAIAGGAALLLFLATRSASWDESLTDLFLPLLLAIVATRVLMGWWGLLPLALTYALSVIVVAFLRWFWLPEPQSGGPVIAWALDSRASIAMAWLIIGTYAILNLSFLEPYLGDVARYFRNAPENVAVRREIRKQAVDTLEALHLSGDYDRIVVVAHSLGTVVAYDMLRAYYARIRYQLPESSKLGPDFATLDGGVTDRVAARALGRQVIAAMAKAVESDGNVRGRKKAPPSEAKLRAWLVTDFVTLGSPLAHAYYLMCKGNTEHALKRNFEVRANAREFPTCPPTQIDKIAKDGWLTFELDGERYFHHGGQFALTRWTNLYFPIYQLLWGDAIGGQLAPIFGDHVVDIAVYTNSARRVSFFAHTLYWDISKKERSKAPHIVALEQAINLEDASVVNGLRSTQDAASSARPV
jgi:hypothetical protein